MSSPFDRAPDSTECIPIIRDPILDEPLVPFGDRPLPAPQQPLPQTSFRITNTDVRLFDENGTAFYPIHTAVAGPGGEPLVDPDYVDRFYPAPQSAPTDLGQGSSQDFEIIHRGRAGAEEFRVVLAPGIRGTERDARVRVAGAYLMETAGRQQTKVNGTDEATVQPGEQQLPVADDEPKSSGLPLVPNRWKPRNMRNKVGYFAIAVTAFTVFNGGKIPIDVHNLDDISAQPIVRGGKQVAHVVGTVGSFFEKLLN